MNTKPSGNPGNHLDVQLILTAFLTEKKPLRSDGVLTDFFQLFNLQLSELNYRGNRKSFERILSFSDFVVWEHPHITDLRSESFRISR
jgi:hypothetical protein